MRVVMIRGTRNAKLTGGRHRSDVWTISPGATFDTCPTTCRNLPRAAAERAERMGLPLAEDRTGGCYAPGRIAHYATLGADATLGEALAELVRDLPHGGLVRWAVVGDVMTAAGRVDRRAVRMLAGLQARRPDATFVGYTHAWRAIGERPAGLGWLRASCETAEDVAEARALGWTAALVAPSSWSSPTDGPAMAGAWGRDTGAGPTFVCPAVTRDRSCATCRACSSAEGTVAFPAHGAGAGAIDAAGLAERAAALTFA